MCSALKKGLAWKLNAGLPLSTQPNPFVVRNPQKRIVMRDCTTTMKKEGVIGKVPDPWSPGFYSLIFLRSKRNGDLRPIIDLSKLNKFIHTPIFSMESAQTVRAVLTQSQ